MTDLFNYNNKFLYLIFQQYCLDIGVHFNFICSFSRKKGQNSLLPILNVMFLSANKIFLLFLLLVCMNCSANEIFPDIIYERQFKPFPRQEYSSVFYLDGMEISPAENIFIRGVKGKAWVIKISNRGAVLWRKNPKRREHLVDGLVVGDDDYLVVTKTPKIFSYFSGNKLNLTLLNSEGKRKWRRRYDENELGKIIAISDRFIVSKQPYHSQHEIVILNGKGKKISNTKSNFNIASHVWPSNLLRINKHILSLTIPYYPESSKGTNSLNTHIFNIQGVHLASFSSGKVDEPRHRGNWEVRSASDGNSIVLARTFFGHLSSENTGLEVSKYSIDGKLLWSNIGVFDRDITPKWSESHIVKNRCLSEAGGTFDFSLTALSNGDTLLFYSRDNILNAYLFDRKDGSIAEYKVHMPKCSLLLRALYSQLSNDYVYLAAAGFIDEAPGVNGQMKKPIEHAKISGSCMWIGKFNISELVINNQERQATH